MGILFVEGGAMVDFAKALADLKAKKAMSEREQAIIAAAQRVLDAVEFDDKRATLYISMPDHEYGFDMTQNIKNPLADAIIRLGAEMDRTD
jgi:poly-gamma-glutamate capsule biosynthesis protein CapA/YwtB (metallophosphatase superfamily)